MVKNLTALEFMEQEARGRRVSKLAPFEEDILLLKQNGYTQEQILKYLKQNGVEAGKTTLNWFIKTRSKSEIQTKPSTRNTSAESDKGNVSIEAASKPPAQNGVSKPFDWRTPIDPNDLI